MNTNNNENTETLRKAGGTMLMGLAGAGFLSSSFYAVQGDLQGLGMLPTAYAMYMVYLLLLKNRPADSSPEQSPR